MIKAIKFLVGYTKHRIEGVSNPAEYYQKIGDDVVPTLNSNFQIDNKPLWLNLGYWKNARTYKDACQDMARLLAESGEFSNVDKLVDVGFGFGEQDILWAQEFNIKKIEGINITPLHVQVATQKVKNINLDNVINYEIGNAIDLPFDNKSVDRVVALESAFHFKPRTEFFKESYRVLNENGILAIADMVSLDDETVNKASQVKGRKEIFIPDENAISKSIYENQLKEAGFDIVSSFSIASYVYTGARKYFYSRALGNDVNTVIKINEKDFLSKKGARVWGNAYGLSDYVIFIARKKKEV